jgi:hypothetical protein
MAPADRLCRLVVMADVPANLAREIVDRGKNAAREQISFDLREPEFDLIEPRRVCRREMQPHVGVRDQEQPVNSQPPTPNSQQALSRGNLSAARSKLMTSRRRCRQSGQSISPSVAQLLIADADYVIATLH